MLLSHLDICQFYSLERMDHNRFSQSNLINPQISLVPDLPDIVC